LVSRLDLFKFSDGTKITSTCLLKSSIDEILSSEDLIPSIEELSDPIGWAARTSMPPI